MKKKKLLDIFFPVITLAIAVVVLAVFLIPTISISSKSYSTIESYLETTAKTHNTPAISASVTQNSTTEFYSYGYANREKKIAAYKDTFYLLGSVSKSFGAFATMLLDERGDISLDDPITNYIPWLNFRLNGKAYSGSELKVSNFLYHTSGLTNKKHLQLSVMKNSDDIIEKNVRTLINTELAFEPSSKYEYGSHNYNVLQYLIEVVTGKSYDTFLVEEVLTPLGLNGKVLPNLDEVAGGKIAMGYKPAFFGTTAQPTPSALLDGNRATGFTLSTSEGISGWLDIFSGKTVISPFWTDLVQRALTPDTSVKAVDGSYYAAGWMITEDGLKIHHDGEVPGFNSRVMIFPQENISITVLANSSAIFAPAVADGIYELVNGGTTSVPSGSEFKMLDTVTSSMTILLTAIICILVFFMVRKTMQLVSGSRNFRKPTIKGYIKIGATVVAAGFAIFLSAVFPSLFGHFWGEFFITFMSPVVPVAFILLSVTAILFFAHSTLSAISYKKN